MAETYDIRFDDALVGKAQVEKQGLYFCFSCRCRLPDENLYRIHVISGGNHEDLGICIPLDGLFGMDKRLPAKRLGEGTLEFVLLPKNWKPQEVVVQEIGATEEMAEENETLPEMETSISEPEEERLPDKPEEEIFIPVSEEEPFEHLDKLENAVMEVQEETIGILLRKEE